MSAVASPWQVLECQPKLKPPLPPLSTQAMCEIGVELPAEQHIKWGVRGGGGGGGANESHGFGIKG